MQTHEAELTTPPDLTGALDELFGRLLEPGEQVVFVTAACYGRREGKLAVLALGHRETDPGVLALTDRRVLFVGADSGRFALGRDDVRGATIEASDHGPLALRLPTTVGTALITGIPAWAQAALGDIALHAPDVAPPRVAAPPLAAAVGHAALPVAAVALAVASWVLTLASVDASKIGSLGLVSALPAPAFVALGLLTCSFCVTLVRDVRPAPLALLHVLALIFMVYGATTLIEVVPSLNVTWRHAGVTRFVMETGGVDRSVDAYSNWPGFFVLLALATRLAGAGSPLALADWAPVALNLLYLAPLVVIARSAGSDQRLVWATVWVFYLTNWVRQDYMSPQGLVYLLYLSLLAALLTWFSNGGGAAAGRWPGARALARMRAHWDRPGGADVGELAPAQRAALVVACIALAAAVVPSHQLTPFAILVTTGALVLVGRCSLRGLPLVVAVMTAAWITLFAAPYLAGHLEALASQLGELGGNVSSNVGARVGGAEEHVAVAWARILMSALLWLLAAAGAIRWLRSRRDGLGHAALAFAPLALVFLQAYGGEILLRVYLFSLPFLALFAASLFVPAATRWRTGVGLGALSVVLVAGLFLTRFGNERILVFTKAEVGVVEHLYATAPRGSLLVAPSANLPWQHRGYGDYRYAVLKNALPPRAGATSAVIADRLASYMAGRRTPAAYVIVTRSVRNYDALLGSAPWGTVADLERGVATSPRFKLVYANPDGDVYALVARSRAQGTRLARGAAQRRGGSGG
jgi:hypothetical protein